MTKQFLDFPITEGKQNKHDRLLMVLLANSTFHEGVRYLKKENINSSKLSAKLGKKSRDYASKGIKKLVEEGYIEAQDDRYVFPKLETGSYSRINMSLVDKLCAMPDKAVVIFAYMNKFKALSGTFSKEWLLEKGLGIRSNGNSFALMNNVFEELEKANLVKVAVQTKEGKYSNTTILFVAEHVGATVKKEEVESEPVVEAVADPSKIVDLDLMFATEPATTPTPVVERKSYKHEEFKF